MSLSFLETVHLAQSFYCWQRLFSVLITVCCISGRLLSRASPEKNNTDKNRREQQNNVENEFSKKRKIKVACSDCETQPSSPKTELCSLKFSSDLREPVM